MAILLKYLKAELSNKSLVMALNYQKKEMISF